MKVAYVCGGTGGHIYPAMSLAEQMNSMGHESVFLGRAESMEEKIVAPLHEFHHIKAYPLIRGKLKANLSLPFKLIGSIIGAYTTIKKLNPQCVIATGGYVTLPVILGAMLNNKNIYIQEQNAVAGIANKIGALFAQKIFVASEEAQSEFGENRAINLGNPVRNIPSDKSFDLPQEYENYSQRIMVVGGSQGALGVNKKVEQFVTHLPNDVLLYWQVGARNFEEYTQKYQSHENVIIVDYINNIYNYMSHADILISRAGASTIAEILCLAKPSILIPFPFATANHQEANARVLEKQGAAWVELESESNQIGEKISAFFKNKKLKESMVLAAHQLAQPHAAQEIVENILKLEGVNS